MSEITEPGQQTALEILDTLAARRTELQAFGVRKLGLFGSYRRNTPNPNSDMDFLADFFELSFDSYMDTKFFLEDLFQHPVDLVLEQNLKPQLRPYILNEVVYVPGL